MKKIIVFKKDISKKQKDQSNNTIKINDQDKYINMLYLNQSFENDKIIIKHLKEN